MNPVEEHLLCAFVERFRSDEASGARRSLADYLSLYPGYETIIAREFLALTEEPDETREANPGTLANENRIGPFRLISVLGRGGQAVVWLAEDERLNRRVALKVLRGLAGDVDEALARFRREASIAAALEDPGICPVYEVGHDEVPWIAMRYVQGRPLANLIRVMEHDDPESSPDPASRTTVASAPEFLDSLTARPASDVAIGDSEPETLPADHPITFDRDSLVPWFEMLARSLHVAHEAGVVHRDIKPGNIIISPTGQPVLLDFGIAHMSRNGGPTLTRSGQLIGTPIYMAPEQIRGEGIDARTDVYALGVTLYEALTGHRPFSRPTIESTYHAILESEAPSLRSHGVPISSDLETVIATAMAKERHRRYATAEALGDDLGRVGRKEPILARRTGRLERMLLWSRRHPASALLILVLAVGIPALTATLAYILATRDDVIEQARIQREEEIGARLTAGLEEFHHGDRALGLREIAETAAEAPETHEALAVHAWLLLQTGKAEEALTVTARSRSLATLHRLALKAVGRSTETEDFEPVADLTALDRFILGSVELTRGHQTRSVEAFGVAMNHFLAAVLTTDRPRLIFTSEYAHALDHIAHHGGEIDPREARAVADSLMMRWPDSYVAAYRAGQLLANLDVEAADRYYERAIDLAPQHRARELRVDRVRFLAKTSRLQSALSLLDGLVSTATDPDEEAQLLEVRSTVKGRMQDFAGGEQDLQRALTARPNRASSWYGLGLILIELNRRDEAIEAFRKAVRLAPTSTHLGRLALCLNQTARKDEAIALARRATKAPLGTEIDADLVRGECWLLLSVAAAASNRNADATKRLQRALEHLPRRHDLWRKLVILLLPQNRTREAQDAARRAFELDPEHMTSNLLLGLTMLQGDEPFEGLELMGEALASERVHPRFHRMASERAAREIFLKVQELAKVADFERMGRLIRKAPQAYPQPDFCLKVSVLLIDIPELDAAKEGADALARLVPRVRRENVLVNARVARKVWRTGEERAAIDLLAAVIDRLRKDGTGEKVLRPLERRLERWRAE